MLILKNSPLHSSSADGIAKVLFPYKGIKCADVNWSLQIEKSEILRFVFTANLRCSIKALTSLTPHLFWGDRERIRPGRGTISHAEEIPPEISVILLNWNKSLFSFWWDVRLWDCEILKTFPWLGRAGPVKFYLKSFSQQQIKEGAWPA